MNQQAVVSYTDQAIALGFDLHSGLSSVRAIQHVQNILNDEIDANLKRKFGSNDQLARANQVIVALGCTAVNDHNLARIIAKGLAEQLVIQGLTYDPAYAIELVARKVVKIEKTMPWVFASKGGPVVTPTTQTATGSTTAVTKTPKVARGGNKKEVALKVYNEFKSDPDRVNATDTDIAKEIVKRVKGTPEEMTFHNAFYYVTRVFQKKYGGAKAKKGRK